MKFASSIGTIALAAYLILVGIAGLVPSLAIPAIVFSILALAAGILLLIGK